MKRLNRKKLIVALEEARQGFKNARDLITNQGTAAWTYMDLHHKDLDTLIVELGGESVREKT